MLEVLFIGDQKIYPLMHSLEDMLISLMQRSGRQPLFVCLRTHFMFIQFSSVAQSCLTLCDPMNRSTPGLPVHHQLPGFTQAHALMRWPKYWSFSLTISPSNVHPRLIFFRMDWLDLLAVQGTLKSLLQHYSSKASILWCSAFFTVQLSHPYMTTGKTIALTRRKLCWQSNVSAFEYAIQVGYNFPSKE